MFDVSSACSYRHFYLHVRSSECWSFSTNSVTVKEWISEILSVCRTPVGPARKHSHVTIKSCLDGKLSPQKSWMVADFTLIKNTSMDTPSSPAPILVTVVAHWLGSCKECIQRGSDICPVVRDSDSLSIQQAFGQWWSLSDVPPVRKRD